MTGKTFPEMLARAVATEAGVDVDRALAIFERLGLEHEAATTYHDKPDMLAEVSTGLGKAMAGLEIPAIPKEELLASRGW